MNNFESAVVIEPITHKDERGFFLESYNQKTFAGLGLSTGWLQDNHSRSTKGVLRGLHLQKDPDAQAKLVRCVRGAIFDVAVDVRPESPQYLKWFGVELTEDNHKMLYVPRGFAHGFLVLSDVADVLYKADGFYAKASEGGVRWDDPKVGIEWPKLDIEFIINDRDRSWPLV